MFFAAIGAAEQAGGGPGVLLRFLVEQLGYGALVGLAVGLAGGRILGVAQARGWMAEPFTQLGVVALPLGCVLASEATGASLFIAAFVAGIAASPGFDDVGKHSGGSPRASGSSSTSSSSFSSACSSPAWRPASTPRSSPTRC